MATVTNKTVNTASMTNNQIMQQTKLITWDEATFTWDEAQGTWDSPYGIRNSAVHTAAMTNKTITP